MKRTTHSRIPRGLRIAVILTAAVVVATASYSSADAALMAGAAKVDITKEGPVNGRLHARALVVKSDDETVVLVTLDVVSLGMIGHIDNDYLGRVRERCEKELGIKPTSIVINTSHCHGVPADDTDARTVRAITQAMKNLVPVKVGIGVGHEDRISENRRYKLKNGMTIDARHAYSMPADEDVAEIGPIDPQIGLLRLDRMDGTTLAVVYNFAMHPIQNVPGKENTADVTGFSSEVIEDNLDEGAVALFVQGCGGDINPIFYKHTDRQRDAEVLGNTLGLSTLKAVRKIKCADDKRLKLVHEVAQMPRADLAPRIEEMEAEKLRLAGTLRGTSLNLKTFLPLVVKYRLSTEFPSYYSHTYLLEKELGRKGLEQLDAENRRNIASYIRNIQTMEQLTRVNTNLRLLKMHHQQNIDAGSRTVDVELVGIRIGDFVLTTFPGELTVQIGLNIKKASPHKLTFVAGYTNGYIYYCPTAEQLKNRGYAQEDSDCILAPEWQKKYEAQAAAILGKL
jgi:hypothetical protein